MDGGRGQGGDAIRAGQSAGEPDPAIPVVIVYITAVAEENGEVYFFNDIYGHDKSLDAVLAKGPPYPGLVVSGQFSVLSKDTRHRKLEVPVRTTEHCGGKTQLRLTTED